MGYELKLDDLPPPTQFELEEVDLPALPEAFDPLTGQMQQFDPGLDIVSPELGEQLSVTGRSGAQRLMEIIQGRPAQAAIELIKSTPVGKGLPQLPELLEEGRQQTPEFVSLSERGTPAAQLGEILAETLPFAAFPASRLGGVPKYIERGLESSSPLAQRLGRLVGKAGTGAAIGGVGVPLIQPEKDLEKAITHGLAYGGLSGAAAEIVPSILKAGVKGIKHPVSKLLEKIFGPYGKPEDIRKTLEAIERTGVEIPSGTILESAALTRAQRILSALPGTGIRKQLHKAAGAIKEQFDGIIQQLQKGPEIQDKMQERLINLSKRVNLKQKVLYDKTLDYGNKKGYLFDVPRFDKTIQNELSKITGKLSRGRRLSKDDRAIRNVLEDFKRKEHIKESKIISLRGKPIQKTVTKKDYRYDDAKFDLNELSQNLESAVSANNTRLMGVFGRLDKSLRSDLKRGINKTGDKKLIDLSSKADKFHKEEVRTLRTKPIRKFLRDDADTDQLIDSFVKTNRPNLLSTLTRNLPKEQKDAVGAHFLSKGKGLVEGEINPSVMARKFRELNPKMKEILFDKTEREQLGSLAHLVKKIGKDFDQLSLPYTGARNAEIWGSLLAGGALAAPIIGKKEEYALGIPALAAAMIAGRRLAKPKLAKKYAKRTEQK